MKCTFDDDRPSVAVGDRTSNEALLPSLPTGAHSPSYPSLEGKENKESVQSISPSWHHILWVSRDKM